MADHHLHASEANLCNFHTRQGQGSRDAAEVEHVLCGPSVSYCFMATVGDASNYVYRKKRGGSCSLDHQDGGISSKEVVVTRNKDNARLYNFKAPFRGDEERVSRNYFSPY